MPVIEKTDAQVKVISKSLINGWNNSSDCYADYCAKQLIDWLNDPSLVPRPDPTMEEVLKLAHTKADFGYGFSNKYFATQAAALRSMGYKLVKDDALVATCSAGEG